MKPVAIAACVFVGCCQAQNPPATPPTLIGNISSSSPLTIDGTAMSPTGSASWPVMERDEIVTQAPALFTTANHNLVILDSNSKVKVSSVGPTAGETKQTYIFIRQGGLTFDAKSSRILICAAGRLFVPETLSQGAVRLDANGSVSQNLTSGVFAEQGKRSCTDAGPGGFLTGVPGAAGGTISPTGATTGTTAGSKAAIAVGVGVAAAAGISSFLSGGSNTIPAPISPIQP